MGEDSCESVQKWYFRHKRCLSTVCRTVHYMNLKHCQHVVQLSSHKIISTNSQSASQQNEWTGNFAVKCWDVRLHPFTLTRSHWMLTYSFLLLLPCCCSDSMTYRKFCFRILNVTRKKGFDDISGKQKFKSSSSRLTHLNQQFLVNSVTDYLRE